VIEPDDDELRQVPMRFLSRVSDFTFGTVIVMSHMILAGRRGGPARPSRHRRGRIAGNAEARELANRRRVGPESRE
jgi:hypothetical protein